MSNEEEKDSEEIKKELAFYKSQTRVLREKNRDLRNALLHAESKIGVEPEEETAEESLTDIRKIIADSKKQITEKLSKFKESIDDTEESQVKPSSDIEKPTVVQATGDNELLVNQIDYLKKEVDRLENFLEQSEMVNDRLRQLLTENSIDVSEIAKAISEVSKSAISGSAVQKELPAKEQATIIPEPVKKEPIKKEPEVQVAPKATTPIQTKAKLDPAIEKLFNEFIAKLDRGLGEEEIKMSILELREKLMDMIPHSRVFYEMQIEYRKWKRNSSSVNDLKNAIKKWEQTIISMSY